MSATALKFVGDIDPTSSLQPAIEFSEGHSAWRQVPRFAKFLIGYGRTLAGAQPRTRRIALISMPCDSAGAGLVALGAMRYRLSVHGADDCSSHYRRLESLCKQNSQCFIRNKKYRGRFILERSEGDLWAKQVTPATRQRGSCRIVIFHWDATDWQLEGEPPVQVSTGGKLAHGGIYEALGEEFSPIDGANTSRSDSAICLAGRPSGKLASLKVLADVRFRSSNDSADLSQLLTLRRESPDNVSRLTFYNTRIGTLDRDIGLCTLVIADGDAAFLKVIGAAPFSEVDVIGVFNRISDRGRLEAAGHKIDELRRQWYTRDDEMLARLPIPPFGITTSVLRRR